MARTRRKTAPGLIHHVVNRGNRRKVIFHKPDDYQAFMSVLREAVDRFKMRLLAFCVMRNHWHLVLWPDEKTSISAFMHWLTSTHVRRYHAHYGLTGTGHLYQARYRNDICKDDRGVLAVMRYVEGNPVAAGLVHRAQDWEWSSLRIRLEGNEGDLLTSAPIELPANWATFVTLNTPRKVPDDPAPPPDVRGGRFASPAPVRRRPTSDLTDPPDLTDPAYQSDPVDLTDLSQRDGPLGPDAQTTPRRGVSRIR